MLAPRLFFHRSFTSILHFAILVTLLLTSCSGAETTPAVISQPTQKSVAPGQALAEITFEAQLPAKLADGQNLYIDLLDEVTGLAFNPARAKMLTSDNQNFGIKIPVKVGSVVKYRYFRDNDPVGTEYTTQARQVRYRMVVVDGPGIVHDIISAWKSAPTQSSDLGRISGQVAVKGSNSPVINALVAAGGIQSMTSSDGAFILEGLPPGLHNLVVYSLDGAFRPFQQGAVVAPESTTPALVLVTPTSPVNVTFIVKPPQDNPSGVLIRLIGNTYTTGNTFADLNGGMNTIASRAPLMSILPDGRYSLTLKLPAGLDLRYKYSLGDGFWNAEHDSNGNFIVRQIIVPDKDTIVQDEIANWEMAGRAPITFSVSVPENTPISDVVSIQLNPFGWTQPIPMWRAEKDHWHYTLYSPLNVFNSATYRYCRNDQCGTADAGSTRGPDAPGSAFIPKDTPQDLQDTVDSWAWLDTSSEPVIVPGSQIKTREVGFLAGVEFMPRYNPSFQPYYADAFRNIRDQGSNAVMLTPTWHLTHQNPPVMAPLAGRDPLWIDLTSIALQSQQNNFSLVIHPELMFDENPQKWWKDAVRDDGWWQSWFDRYRTFLLYHADLATQTGAKALVIGDEKILPALPGGFIAEGESSNVPGDAVDRWRKLIAAVRTRYNGKLIFMLPYSGGFASTPEFLNDVDALYLVVQPPLIKADQPSFADLETSLNAMLDTDFLKIQQQTNHPVYVGLQYPSVQGEFDGCVEVNGDCQPFSAFQQPAPEIPAVSLGLKDQADAYAAMLSAINQRAWVAGFFASGYYPPVELRDLSISVRNKPAGDMLWYWYPRLLGQIKP